MSNKLISVEFIDDNLKFQVCYDLFDNTKSFYYFTKLGEYETDRFEYKKEVSTSIYYDYLMLGSSGISKRNWCLSFHEKKQVEPNFSITKHFDEISYTYFEGNNKITKVAYSPVKDESFKSIKEEKSVTVNIVDESNKIYEEAILFYNELYKKIENKNAFKEQLIDCISGWLEESEIIAKENLDNYFIAFIDSEKNLSKIKDKYNYEYFISHYKELKSECSDELVLRNIITEVIEQYDCKPDILYSEEFVENELLSSIYFEIRQYNSRTQNSGLTKESVFNKINELFKDKIQNIKDKNDFSKKLEMVVSSEMPFYRAWDISEIIDKANVFIDKYLEKESKYYSFIAALGGEEKTVFLNADKKNKFLMYGLCKENLSEELILEYKIYKQLKQEYNNFIYLAGTHKLRPAISRIPNWIEYFKKLIDICVKSEILIFKDNHYKFNSFDKMAIFVQELQNLKN